jgi:hypothetical protein
VGNVKITKKVAVSGDMEIYIDGQNLGMISDYETKMFDVPLGQHIIRAKLRWMGSTEKKIIVTEDQTIVLTVRDKKWINYFNYGYATVLLLLFQFHFMYKLAKIYIILFFIPPFLLLIFIYTLGKNKRMEIIERKFKN